MGRPKMGRGRRSEGKRAADGYVIAVVVILIGAHIRLMAAGVGIPLRRQAAVRVEIDRRLLVVVLTHEREPRSA